MKTLTKGLFGATAATALAVASASPAQARPGDGIDGEDILTGVLIAGAAAAVIAAATSGDDDRYDDGYYGRNYDNRYGNRYGQRGYRMNAQQAVRQCAAAAQQRASRYGQAQITDITDVDRKRGGFEVEGRLVVDESRYGRNGWNNGYRTNSRYDRRGRYNRYERDLDRGRFSCEIRNGRITDIDIDGI